MTHSLEASFAVTSTAPQVAIVNPAASGVVVLVTGARVFGEQLVTMEARRYDEELSLSPTQEPAPDVWSLDGSALAGAATATRVSHAIGAPSAQALSLALTIYEGQGKSHLALPGAVAVPPGSSFVLETPVAFEGDGPTIGFRLEFDVEPEQPVPYALGELPAAGAWTDLGPFALPRSWGAVVARVSYQAHGSSTKGRARLKAVWLDAAGNEIPQPIVSSSIDASSAPEAARDTHHLVARFPAVVPAGQTQAHAFAFDVLPGAASVRFDLAEHDPTETNEGSVSVTLTGR